ncbi:MAG: AAA family ATPase [Methylococcaceae bacterium]|nr:AAA family ATPase [Methylococcaceae bacterium]
MYQEHFHLSTHPFGLTPDTRFFHALPAYREALNVLFIALQSGEGFIKITGNVGTGKTLLCRKLLNNLSAPFISAYIPNPHLTPNGLRMAIADELGIQYTVNTAEHQLLKLINTFLIEAAMQGKKPVLIIDEAQAMPIETLEALRLITNLETETQKLLQIVLFGQPELDQLLQNKVIRQLRQRITFSYALKPLSAQNVADYIQHRLRVAGANNPWLFSPWASKAIHYFSRGIPRLVNILAHKALISAYGKGSASVGLKQVYFAALDTEDTKASLRLRQFAKQASLGLFLLIIAYLGVSKMGAYEFN